MYDIETETKFGIDKLELMCKFMKILAIEEVDEVKINSSLLDIKTFLAEKIKRELTGEEYLNMLQGIHDYMASDPATNERINSINYLLNLDFVG
jgi:hypothetical protein